jgi:NAD(P)H-flavin reductase
MDATVIETTRFSDDLIKLRLRFERPVRHRSGQYSVVSVPGVEGKAYLSIASPASDQPQMTFLIRLGDSPLDQALGKLEVGAVIDAESPAGKFVPASDGDALIFIAGGTGIAPMLAMLLQLVEAGDQRPMHLIYGIRNRTELAFESELARLEAGGVVVTIIEDAPIELDSDWLGADLTRLHVCGPKAMIDAIATQAETLGCAPILTEPY